jgi:hypothetical protein
MLLIDETKTHEIYTRAVTPAWDSKECNCDEPSRFRHNTFYANIGYSCIVSKFYVTILFSALTRMFPKPTFAP